MDTSKESRLIQADAQACGMGREHAWWLIALLLLGALRFFHLGAPFHETICARALPFSHMGDAGLWVDEAYTFEVARMPLREALGALTTTDVSPPLYYLLLHGWLAMGSSDLFARLPGALFSLLSILLAALLAGASGGSRAARMTALACGISSFHLFYGQELRMYPLVGALAMASTLLFIRASESRGRRWWTLYGVSCALLFWTHYHTAFLIFAHGVEALIARRAWRPWAAAAGAALVTLAPWAPSFLHQVRHVTGLGGLVASPADLLAAFGHFVLGYSLPLAPQWMAIAGLAVIAGLVIVLRVLRREGVPHVRLIGLAMLLPPPLLMAVSLISGKSIFNARYFMASAILLWILLSLGAASRSRRLSLTCLSALVLLCAANVAGDFNRWFVPAYRVQEFAPVVQYLEQQERRGDTILIQSRGAWWPFLHYYRGRNPFHVIHPCQVPAEIGAQAKASRRIWLVSASPHIEDPGGRVESWLKANLHFAHGIEAPGSMPVRLYLFEKRGTGAN